MPAPRPPLPRPPPAARPAARVRAGAPRAPSGTWGRSAPAGGPSPGRAGVGEAEGRAGRSCRPCPSRGGPSEPGSGCAFRRIVGRAVRLSSVRSRPAAPSFPGTVGSPRPATRRPHLPGSPRGWGGGRGDKVQGTGGQEEGLRGAEGGRGSLAGRVPLRRSGRGRGGGGSLESPSQSTRGAPSLRRVQVPAVSRDSEDPLKGRSGRWNRQLPDAPRLKQVRERQEPKRAKGYSAKVKYAIYSSV